MSKINEKTKRNQYLDSGNMDYEAYCTVCQKVVYNCANGAMVQAGAERHTIDTGHETIVGFRVIKV